MLIFLFCLFSRRLKVHKGTSGNSASLRPASLCPSYLCERKRTLPNHSDYTINEEELVVCSLRIPLRTLRLNSIFLTARFARECAKDAKKTSNLSPFAASHPCLPVLPLRQQFWYNNQIVFMCLHFYNAFDSFVGFQFDILCCGVC